MEGTKNLTYGPIGRQLCRLAAPIMATSFIQMAYSLTDMAWVGRLGSEAVAAVGAVGIFTWMSGSISLLNKVGAEVSVGQAIGQQDAERAVSFASHNVTMASLLAAVWAAALFLFAWPVMQTFGLQPDITAQAVRYLRIVAAGIPFFIVSAAFTGVFNAAGRSQVPFAVCAAGLALNMLLDPLLIFAAGWGTDGAAVATVLSQAVVFVLFVYRLKIKKTLLGGFRFWVRMKRPYVRRIVRLGLPVAALNILFAFINMYICKLSAAEGGHIGLMTFTAGGQIEAIAWNTAQGFSTALSAFVAQNYAAGQTQRVLRAYRSTLRLTGALGLFCTGLFIAFGGAIFSLFVPEEAAYVPGGVFMRIDGYSQLFMMLEITMQGMFYGTGRTLPPALISIGGNLLRIPVALCLTGMGWGVAGIWWAVSLSSILKGIGAFGWFSFVKKRLFPAA